MPFEHAFQQTFIYLAAAVVAVLVGKRLGLGAVLGYLIAGAAIGPWGFKLIGNEGEEVTHFAEFGVVVMLFLIGLELRPALLWKMRRLVLGLGLLQVVLSAGAIGGVLMLFGTEWQGALAVGLILAMSSTAIVLQTLTEKGLLRTDAGQKVFAVLLFQDMAVIPIIALLPLLGTGGGGGASHGDASAWMDRLPGLAQALVTVGAVVLIVALAHTGMRRVFHWVAQTRQREGFTGLALLLVVGVALLMGRVGLSPALGTFVAGVVLANSEYRHELESDLEPFKGLLLGLFFLGVGAGIDFGYIGAHPWLVAGGALGLMAVKGGLLYGVSALKGNDRACSLLFSASLAAGGEFAFVLITLAVTARAFGDETARACVAMVALSMAATPLLIVAAQRVGARLGPAKKDPDREPDVVDDGNPVIICGFGRFGHAVGRLVRNLGYGCTVLDRDSDQVDLLRRIGIPVHYGDGSRLELLTAAGAAHAKVLVIALRDEKTALLIAEHARRHYPHLKIFLRAHSRLEAYAYLDAGHERIYRETLDSSLRMGIDVLTLLGMTEEAAQRAAALYRESDEAMVRQMASARHNAEEYTSAAREAVRSLDEIMRRDLEAREGGRE
ncbi:MAG TPA: monovalent cation:proton antiporter-2 (CPA2) family protein [Verrucomicrobiales bacterium]|nr:monovalent cation:proton antiporter-2 (CPA2) family protein [Verrucomicrobiales bacterium]